MLTYQREFIEFAIDYQVLKFGEFTLKSGRISPYFFNAGLFNDGLAISKLGQFYADAIVKQQLTGAMLFGPAYKGIPLVTTTAIALADKYNKNLPFAYNRKEAKQHGEGGRVVGSAPAGQVLLIDDVITAGTAILESIQLISESPATLGNALVAIDRQERSPNSNVSAIAAINRDYGVKIHSIVTLDDIIQFLDDDPKYEQNLQSMQAYKKQYGI